MLVCKGTPEPMSPKSISPEVVRSEVTRFWDAFSAKDAERLQEFYAHESVGFGSSSTRSEPGRLAATRRKREYFNSSGPIRTQLSPIEVVLLDEGAAVASYTFEFHAERFSLTSGKSEEHIRNGRATQVFAFDPDGKIRIFHEHFSVPGN